MDYKKNLIRTFYPSMPNRINSTITDFQPWGDPEDKNNISMAERIVDFYTTTTLPSKDIDETTFKENSAKYIREDLEYLNRKLSVVRKTITAWDTYKVVEVVTEPELLGAKIQGLPLNSSLIVNTPASVLLNNNNYRMGDIVFKDVNGIIHRLQSQPSGFFYPSNIQRVKSKDSDTVSSEDPNTTQLEGSNTIEITYSFASGSQPHNSEAEITTKPLTEPAQDIKANINMFQDSLPYNHKFELKKGNSESDIVYHSDIPPKIFAYVLDEGIKGEEIYIDQDQLWTIEGSGSNKTIMVTNNTSFNWIYITMR